MGVLKHVRFSGIIKVYNGVSCIIMMSKEHKPIYQRKRLRFFVKIIEKILPISIIATAKSP